MNFDVLDLQEDDVRDVTDRNQFYNVSNLNQSTSGSKLSLSGRQRPTLATQKEFKAGQYQTSNAAMIPAPIAALLSQVSQQYGLPFDMGKLTLQQMTPDNLNQFRTIVDMMRRNAKLIPEFVKLAKQLLKADYKMVEYYKDVTKLGIKHQEKIDKATADIFASMVKHTAKSALLEYKTNRRADLKNAQNNAELNFFEDSVIGDAVQLANATIERQIDTQRMLTASKKNKINFNAIRRQDDIRHNESAYQHVGRENPQN